ncbi:MAG: hypothetical protein IJ934_02660 [Acetobacter sp.]|nr:hypothetical protein [Acetobacter sp.]
MPIKMPQSIELSINELVTTFDLDEGLLRKSFERGHFPRGVLGAKISSRSKPIQTPQKISYNNDVT